MKNSVIAPAALIALREALVKIYWFKSDLRSFLTHAISDPCLVNNLDWGTEPKRNIVATLVEMLAQNEARYQTDLLNLMAEVVRIRDFSHFDKVEDGLKKAKDAKAAVEALRAIYATHSKQIKEQEEAQERRAAAQVALSKNQGIKENLTALNSEVTKMIAMSQASAAAGRGFKLEKILNELFNVFDLNPKAPFKINGEQIDGAFTLENTEYLMEAKWENKPVERKDLDIFNAKIERKLENTLGLFFSFNGFSSSGIELLSLNRPKMILMDGSDLMAVLEGRVDLKQLLLRKRRYAATTGNIFLPFRDF